MSPRLSRERFTFWTVFHQAAITVCVRAFSQNESRLFWNWTWLLEMSQERNRELVFKCHEDVGFTKIAVPLNDAFCTGYHLPLVFQGRWGSGRHRSFQVWLALQGEFQQHREQYHYCSGKGTSGRLLVAITFLDTPSFGQSRAESHLHWVHARCHFLFMGKGCALPSNSALQKSHS